MSNMNNVVGCPPITRMLDKGLKVGLGTDAFGHDMFQAMMAANILLAHNSCDPAVGFNEALTMQLKTNPEIMSHFLSKKVGVIEKGAYADIITVDYCDPITLFNASNAAGHILFGMTGRLVNDTIINGVFVMKDKLITKVDQKAIHAKSRERAAKIWPML